MGRSTSCLKIIICGSDSADKDDLNFSEVDPTKIRERLEEKTKKKVDIISPQPKKDSGGGDKKPDGKYDKKSEEKREEKKKEEEKKPTPRETLDERAFSDIFVSRFRPPMYEGYSAVLPITPMQSTVVLKIRLHNDGCIQKIRKIIYEFKGVDEVIVDGPKDLVTVKGAIDVNEIIPYLKEKLKRSVEVVSKIPRREWWNDGPVNAQQYAMESQPPQMFSDENPNACSIT